MRVTSRIMLEIGVFSNSPVEALLISMAAKSNAGYQEQKKAVWNWVLTDREISNIMGV